MEGKLSIAQRNAVVESKDTRLLESMKSGDKYAVAGKPFMEA